MDRAEYDRLKQEIEARYQRSIGEAEAERKEGLKSVETVWLLSQKIQAPAEITESLTWADMARQVFPKLQEPFTRIDVENAIRETFEGAKPLQNSLGGVMTRMCARNAIELVQAGAGPIPNKYRMKRSL